MSGKVTSFVPPAASPNILLPDQIEGCRVRIEECLEEAAMLVEWLREHHAHVAIGDPGFCASCDVDWPCPIVLPMFGWPEAS